MNTAALVGRTGGLAIALGIGATLGLTAAGTAAADDSGPSASGPSASGPSAPTRAAASSPRHTGPVIRVGAARTDAVGRPAAPGSQSRVASGSRRPAAAIANASASGTTSAATVTTPKAQSVDPFTAFFNNATPRITVTQTGQSGTGVVAGTISVDDPDSTPVGLAVTRVPAHGTVTISGGQYAYTADPLLAHTGYTDTFQVEANDADSGLHIHGLVGLLNLLTFGLLGESGHRASTTVTVAVAAFNNAPTASVRIIGPNPVTGVVTGAVLGRDPNGDILTYTGSALTAKGSVSVAATGEFIYTPTVEALAAATAAGAAPTDRRDTFTVTIDDGYGGITPVSVIVPVGLTDAAPPLPTFCGCTLMPADTVFHADVSTLPVLAKSSTWTSLLGGTLRAAWGGAPWMDNTAGMPVNTVSASRPTEVVIFNRGLVTSGPTIDDRPYAIPDYPLVEGMPNVPAWDRHLLVFQEGTCISQELYNVANGVELPANGIGDALANAIYASQYGSAWIAEAGVRYDMNSPLYPLKGQANASQLPFLPLILRPDELERGSIDHMLGIVIAKDRGTGYAWPARSGDGTGTNPNGVPMGTVFRLSATFDISRYDAATQVVLRALQQHGAVVYDSWGPGQNGAGLLAMSNGWTGTAYLTAQRELSTIPLSAFEAVDVLTLASDPAAGWVIRL